MRDVAVYRVKWCDEDHQYVGLVDEFPSLSWLADTEVDALTGIANLTKQVRADLAVEPSP